MRWWPAWAAALAVTWLVAGRGWALALLVAALAPLWLSRGDTKTELRVRRNLAKIAGPAWVRRCKYCSEPADGWDHVIPFSDGGLDARSNLVPACTRCNSSKNGSSPEEWWERIGNGAPYPDSWPRTR